MDCKYASNRFCRSLPDALRATLCAHCHIRCYPKGMVFSQHKWADRFSVLVEGINALGQFADTARPSLCRTSGVARDGTILSLGALAPLDTAYGSSDLDEGMFSRDTVCVTDMAVAVFDNETVLALFKSDMDFVHNLFWNVRLTCSMESELLLMSQANAYSSIRYTIDFFNRAGLRDYTHAQVALVSNHTRPVVTATIRQIMEKEPELFGLARA